MQNNYDIILVSEYIKENNSMSFFHNNKMYHTVSGHPQAIVGVWESPTGLVTTIRYDTEDGLYYISVEEYQFQQLRFEEIETAETWLIDNNYRQLDSSEIEELEWPEYSPTPPTTAFVDWDDVIAQLGNTGTLSTTTLDEISTFIRKTVNAATYSEGFSDNDRTNMADSIFDTFFRHIKAGTYDTSKHPAAYLNRAVKNQIFMHKRRLLQRGGREIPMWAEVEPYAGQQRWDPGFLATVDDRTKEEFFEQAEKILSATQFNIISYLFEGFKGVEIADILKTSPQNVNWHLQGARTKIKELLPQWFGFLESVLSDI